MMSRAVSEIAATSAASIIALWAVPAEAAAARGVTLEPIARLGLGSTLFRFEAVSPIDGAGDIPNGAEESLVQSELEFPLDAPIVGMRLRAERAGAGERSAGLRVAAWTNPAGPRERMEDTDWLGARSSSGRSTSSVLYKFSYTRSRAELRWIGGELGFDFGPFLPLGRKTRYGLAISAERMTYRIHGAEGWQRLPGDPRQDVALPDSVLALRYSLVRLRPRLFAEVGLAQSARAGWKAVLSAGPAFAWDHDDHVLRKKESDTFAAGWEIGARLELAVRVAARLHLVAGADAAYFRAKGEMDQRFYGDDPMAPGDQTGLTYEGLTTRIIGLGGGADLAARYEF